MAGEHAMNGRWFLTSSEHVDDLLQAMGCSFKIRKKLCPELMATGPNGHVLDIIVDLELKVARRCLYVHNVLIRETIIPFDVDVPYWGYNEKFVTTKAHVDNMHKMSGTETGDDYVAHWVVDVDEDKLTLTWTSGGVVCIQEFKKMES